MSDTNLDSACLSQSDMSNTLKSTLSINLVNFRTQPGTCQVMVKVTALALAPAKVMVQDLDTALQASKVQKHVTPLSPDALKHTG